MSLYRARLHSTMTEQQYGTHLSLLPCGISLKAHLSVKAPTDAGSAENPVAIEMTLMSLCPVTVTRCLDKGDLRKGSAFGLQSEGTQSTEAEGQWRQGVRATGHSVSAVRKQRAERNGAGIWNMGFLS